MRTLIANVRAFLRDEEGLTTVEYAVAGGLIAVAVVTAFTDLGTAVKDRIGQMITAVGGGSTPTPSP